VAQSQGDQSNVTNRTRIGVAESGGTGAGSFAIQIPARVERIPDRVGRDAGALTRASY